MIRRPPRSTPLYSSAASDVYKRQVQIPHKGQVKDTIIEVLGGVRSACTYIGAKRLKDMGKCTTFVRVNNVVNRVFNGFE